jgi:hypothetical protein
MSRTVLSWSCGHAPFTHADAIDFLSTVADEYQPDEVICLGDELDNHAISYHESDPDGFSAGMELDLAVAWLEKLYQLFPEGKSCESNHTSLPYRRVKSAGLPKALLREYRDVLGAPLGWEWADRFVVDDVIYTHGEEWGGMYAMKKAMLHSGRNVVMGHLHSNFGVLYHATRDALTWGAAAGCLVDSSSYAMAYGRKYPRKPILGCVVVSDGYPRCIPMILDSEGNWTGKI